MPDVKARHLLRSGIRSWSSARSAPLVCHHRADGRGRLTLSVLYFRSVMKLIQLQKSWLAPESTQPATVLQPGRYKLVRSGQGAASNPAKCLQIGVITGRSRTD